VAPPSPPASAAHTAPVPAATQTHSPPIS
jgi:hypothetical protein